MIKRYPARIVCLSAEAVEILFALGCGRQVVGVTGFATEPPAARLKPRVSGFSKVNYDKVDRLKPDLIITFSDVQAEAAKELIRRGHTVLATNQRSLNEVLETILLLGLVVGREAKAQALMVKMQKTIFGKVLNKRTHRSKRPKIYFEEWNDPLISGIRWVGELIEAAGGEDIFPELRNRSRAPDRIVTGEEIIRRRPDIIIASWCGNRVNLDAIRQRPGWHGIPAVRNGHIYEINSAHLLQPGLSLLKGFQSLQKIIEKYSAV